MGYYNILLTDAAQKRCTITTSFGNYEYNRLPMGVCMSPYIFKDQMISLMDNLEFVRIYPKNLLVITLG